MVGTERWPWGFSLVSSVPASPAAPFQTVRAGLPHTACRHRSPPGMRGSPSGLALEPVHLELVDPVPVVGPEVESVLGVFGTGEFSEAFMDVAVDGFELPGRVSVPEVGALSAQHAVEVANNDFDGEAHVAAVGDGTNLGSYRRRRSPRRPTAANSNDHATKTRSCDVSEFDD